MLFQGPYVPVLLMPHKFVYVAPIKQFLVSADVVDPAFFHDEDGIRGHQH